MGQSSMTDILNTIADYTILSAIIPLAYFIIRYSLFSPVERTPEGVNQLLLRVAMLGLIVVVVLSLFFGNYVLREFARVIVYGSVVYFLWIDAIQLTRVQKQHRWTRWAWLQKLLKR